MDAVKSGRFTIIATATQFSVPRKTLDDRIKGRVTHGSKPGVSTALTSIEEDSLVSYLIYLWRIVAFPSHVLWLRPFLGQLQRDVEHVIDLILSMDQGKSGGLCSNTGTLNWHFEGLIHWREPEGLGDEIVFWILCCICGEWAHNLCAFGKNSITRQYVCINC